MDDDDYDLDASVMKDFTRYKAEFIRQKMREANLEWYYSNPIRFEEDLRFLIEEWTTQNPGSLESIRNSLIKIAKGLPILKPEN
jgi:hypothetical protein